MKNCTEVVMSKKFTSKASAVLSEASKIASSLGHTYVGSEHLLLALCASDDSVAAKLLERRGASFDSVKNELCARVGTGEHTYLTENDITPRTKHIIDACHAKAELMSQTYVGTEHILLALLSEPGCTAVSLLEALKTGAKELEDDILSFREDLYGNPRRQAEQASVLADCPTLQKYGKDLTAIAREGKLDPVIGRERETERVIKILSRRTKNNPCLIGEPGVGKTAVVEGLAARIAENKVPQSLADKYIVMLDLSSMVAGAKYRGEFEERMKSTIDELTKHPSIIVFIDEIHTLTGIGAAEGAVDAANILKPALARGEIKLIGATTTAEYRRHIEKDAALDRRFGPVYVNEPTMEEAISILSGLRDKYEAHHKVKITDEAIRAAVSLSTRYIGEKHLPDKALDLLDEAAVSVAMRSYADPPELTNIREKLYSVRREKEEAICSQDFEKAAALRDAETSLKSDYEQLTASLNSSDGSSVSCVKEDDIAKALSLAAGIPENSPHSDDREQLISLAATLKQHIIGQDHAADALARTIQRSGVGLGDADRPIGSFIFLGPTGVGKTELCKVLAQALFGNRNEMLRIDMSELSESHSVSKLIGSPPGYVGYGESGILTEHVRRKPYSVVLLDEIEKAHPDVFHILLQILDDGRLTDSEGRVVSFRNTVIIMTSNIGAEKLTDNRIKPGFSHSPEDNTKDAVISSLRESFRPEFINRIDEIIVFNPLGKKELISICSIMLENVNAKLEKLGISIVFKPEVAEYIVDKSYDRLYGARPLRRAIRELIENPMTDSILRHGTVKDGDTVFCSVKDMNIAFDV